MRQNKNSLFYMGRSGLDRSEKFHSLLISDLWYTGVEPPIVWIIMKWFN